MTHPCSIFFLNDPAPTEIYPLPLPAPLPIFSVSGNPTLALNSGGSADYASGSGSTSLSFDYTIQPGDSATRHIGSSHISIPVTSIPRMPASASKHTLTSRQTHTRAPVYGGNN